MTLKMANAPHVRLTERSAALSLDVLIALVPLCVFSFVYYGIRPVLLVFIGIGTAMLCEVSGAANSMMRRWESVFREYPDILSDAENRASVGRTIQKLRDYLNNLEDKMEELL